MAIYFSIAPPPVGTDNLNIPLIPNMEEIIKFSKGDLGIADSINTDFLYKTISLGKFPDMEAGGIFSQLGGIGVDKDINSYRKEGSDRFDIPKGDFKLEKDDQMGLKSLEKTIITSIFETQKPYMELIPSIIKVMSKLEIISAKVLGLVDRSKNPTFNPKSLTFKLNESTEKLDQLSNLSKNKPEIFEGLTTEDKIGGNVDLVSDLGQSTVSVEETYYNNTEFDWKVISTEYSTGEYIPSIEYKKLYRNITETSTPLDNSKNNSEIDRDIIEDDKPPTIIFAYYNENGDPINPPKSWLDRIYDNGQVGPGTTKWYGKWDQLNDNDEGRYNRYLTDLIDDRLSKKIGRKDNKLSKEMFDFIQPKVKPKEVIREANSNCFMSLITKGGKDGLELGMDSVDDINKVTRGKKKTFLSKKINYKGKQVLVDPEVDYMLQVIKIVPTKNVWFDGKVDKYNNNLKRTTPLVGNYKGENVEDVLPREEYVPVENVSSSINGPKRRVHTIHKYNYNWLNTENINLWDNKVAYVIEGIRSPVKKEDETNSEKKKREKEWYNKTSFFSAVKDFIDILLDIALEVLPELKSLVKLLKSPHEFIFDIIFKKMGENFSAFSTDLMGKYRSLDNFDDKFEKEKFIKSDNLLSKFVSLDENLDHKFILDGFSGMELLGFTFGINIIDLYPKMVLNKSSNKFSLNQKKESAGNVYTQNSGSVNVNDGDMVDARKRVLNDRGEYEWETISTEYSTGKFIEGVDYDYIYIDEDVERLLSKGDELFNAAMSGNGRDNATDALTNYNMALEKDPNNRYIKDKINELKDKFNMEIQMIFQMLMNMISFPMKMVISILGEFKDFFEKLIELPKIPDTLKELLSFQWILKYTKPTAIMDMIGLKFDPELLFKWLGDIKDPKFDPNFKFDLNDIVAAPFLSKLPEVNKDQLEVMGTSPLGMMTASFKLIEELINKIICFLFHILGIDQIIECPKLEISKLASSNLPLEDLQSVLNGDSSALGPESGGPDKFIYKVKLSDGTIIEDLNYVELQNFMRDNKDYNYEVKY